METLNRDSQKHKKFKPSTVLPMNTQKVEKKPNQSDMICGCCKKFKEVVVGSLEKFFYNYGKFVAR